MVTSGTLLNCEEAQESIERIEDPITRNFVNMAFVSAVKRVYIEKREPPRGDFDMKFFAEVLESFFSEHDVLARTLAGEKVGEWFED